MENNFSKIPFSQRIIESKKRFSDLRDMATASVKYSSPLEVAFIENMLENISYLEADFETYFQSKIDFYLNQSNEI